MQGDEQENAQPGRGRAASDPDKNQNRQQEVEYEQKHPVVTAEKRDRPVEEQIARLRPARSVQAESGDGLKRGLIKAVVETGHISHGCCEPAGQSHHRQIAPPVFRPPGKERTSGKTGAKQQIIWKHRTLPLCSRDILPIFYPTGPMIAFSASFQPVLIFIIAYARLVFTIFFAEWRAVCQAFFQAASASSE